MLLRSRLSIRQVMSAEWGSSQICDVSDTGQGYFLTLSAIHYEASLFFVTRLDSIALSLCSGVCPNTFKTEM